MSLERVFPNLQPGRYRITSPRSSEYNCIAWAARQDDAWWWPDPYGEYFWPDNVPRDETLAAFAAAYATIGFAPCQGPELEPGLEKIAIFARGGVPTHAARQLPNGFWTSKLGEEVDIEHEEFAGVAGPDYGNAVLFLSRPLEMLTAS